MLLEIHHREIDRPLCDGAQLPDERIQPLAHEIITDRERLDTRWMPLRGELREGV